MTTKSTEECDVEIWAAEFRQVLDEFVAMVKRNGDYPSTMLPGEWDEMLMIWDGASDEN